MPKVDKVDRKFIDSVKAGLIGTESSDLDMKLIVDFTRHFVVMATQNNSGPVTIGTFLFELGYEVRRAQEEDHA